MEDLDAQESHDSSKNADDSSGGSDDTSDHSASQTDEDKVVRRCVWLIFPKHYV